MSGVVGVVVTATALEDVMVSDVCRRVEVDWIAVSMSHECAHTPNRGPQTRGLGSIR